MSRFQSKPSQELWRLLKRILKYIKGTLDLKLVYKSDPTKIVVGYADANWGGNLENRKSTTSYLFKLFDCPVSWSSKAQPTVALSSTEAEYMALTASTCEGIWLKSLLIEIGAIDSKTQITIFEDNQSAIRVAKNPELHKRLKHVDIKYHFIREKVESDEIEIKYLDTYSQIGDIFTKPLQSVRFVKLREGLIS